MCVFARRNRKPRNGMKITLLVLLASLTAYCGASVLSLPPSLIATAASLARHHVRQTRDSHGSATITAGATTIHLPQQHNHPVAYPQPLQWQAVRPKKDATGFRLGSNIATNGYTGTDTSSDDSLGLLSIDNNNKVSGNLADGKDAYESRSGNGIRKLPDEYNINALLAGAADRLEWQNENAQQQQPRSAQWWHIQAPRIRAMQMKEFFTPLKYWAHHCQPPEHNCPQEYYRALLADRSRAAAAEAKLMDDFTASDGEEVKVKQLNTSASAANEDDDVNVNAHVFTQNDDGGGFYDSMDNINDDDAVDNVYNDADAVAEMSYDEDEGGNAGNDILMLLSGEQDVMKFLSWAMEQLYPYQHFVRLNGSERAEYYHPGMFNWKKLNLSGHLEPPLMVEEPQYVIVRREQLEDDLPPGPQYKDDPFIPPRGRKHNLPDLDALLNRYETFVPNRGKRDKIKDIFKYDDLFFPNRGKKHKPPTTATVALIEQLQHNSDDKANDMNAIDNLPEGNVDTGGQIDGRRTLLLRNQVDSSDDSNLTASPAAVAISRLLAGWMKRLRPHDGNALGTQRSGFDKNNDDNSYSETIDSDVAIADGYSSGNGERPARIARLRRLPTAIGGITRMAANRLLSMPSTISSAERQQNKRPTRRQGRLPQQQPAMLRYFIRQLRQQHAQRRDSWQLPLLSNQVRTNNNDLDLLTWRQQQQENNNKPWTAPHPQITWLQHSQLQQEKIEQPKGERTEHHRLQRLFGGIAAGRSSRETKDIGGI
ncbi:uncharacterized protein natalisin isoform X2 [Bactrocera oleae]|uniref:uncharacterized protein natalisin isoform X2 n=1 Tax=Bactrocera oleae TaxID=104688 RepID=UPI00387E83FA